MKILINNVAVKRDSGGVYTILNDLYQSAKKDQANSYIFILGARLFEDTPNIKIIVRKDLQKNYVKRTLFDLWTGKKYINKYNPDVIVSMQNTAMLRLSRIKQFVYLHQPLPFQREKLFNPLRTNERQLSFYQMIVGFFIKLTLRRSTNTTVIVQSNWLKDELIKRGIKDATHIIVSRPQTEINDIQKKKSLHDTNNFFFPSTAMLYKNHRVVVDALQQLTPKERSKIKIYFTLTLDEYNKLVGKEKPNEIILLGRISKQDVMRFFSKSTLLFPSYIETYGLPIIEAKSLDRPLIVADVPVLRETVSDYDDVQYFPPFDSISLANCIRTTMLQQNTISNVERVLNDSSNSLNELIQIFSSED